MALDLGLTTYQLLSALDGLAPNIQSRRRRLDDAIDRALAVPAGGAAFRTAAVGRRPYISARTGPEGLLGSRPPPEVPQDWTALSVDGSHIDVDRHLAGAPRCDARDVARGRRQDLDAGFPVPPVDQACRRVQFQAQVEPPLVLVVPDLDLVVHVVAADGVPLHGERVGIVAVVPAAQQVAGSVGDHHDGNLAVVRRRRFSHTHYKQVDDSFPPPGAPDSGPVSPSHCRPPKQLRRR